MNRAELGLIIAAGIAWNLAIAGLITVFRWAGRRRDQGDTDAAIGQAADGVTGPPHPWHARPCGCAVRCSPPDVLTCPRHAARREDILDLLLWADELKDRL